MAISPVMSFNKWPQIVWNEFSSILCDFSPTSPVCSNFPNFSLTGKSPHIIQGFESEWQPWNTHAHSHTCTHGAHILHIHTHTPHLTLSHLQWVKITSMHSSRMRTICSSSCLMAGGVYLPRGCLPGGVSAQGVSVRGVCPGGVCLGGCLPGVCVSQHALGQTPPPPLWTEWQTGVKT